ncbi:MAG: hypothetical protein AUJ98_01120 [Bacteroidetes bacterium CG2_30_33_31]|nr:MAG: hypothetical protein AUJ98_01120 [Bacteroidetes bacterium CG2_30_33_31]
MLKRLLLFLAFIILNISGIKAQDYTGIKMGIKLPYTYNIAYYTRISDHWGSFIGAQATTFPFGSVSIGYMKMWGGNEKIAEILREPFTIGAGVDIGLHYYFGADNRRYYVSTAVEWMKLLKRDIKDIVIENAFGVDLDSYPEGPILKASSVKPLTLNSNYLNLGFIFGDRFLFPNIPAWEMSVELEISKTVFSHHFLFSDYRYITPVEKITSKELKKLMLVYGWFPSVNVFFFYKFD